MLRLALALLLFSVTASFGLNAASFKQLDPATGWTIYTFEHGKTTVKLAPEAGFNVFSIVHDGRELLRQAPALSDLPGCRYGVPISYPTPGRVKNAVFEFAHKRFRLPSNSGPNFIHGLVNDKAWTITRLHYGLNYTMIVGELWFKPGTEQYKHFPFEHRLEVKLFITEAGVKWNYTVDNRIGGQALPFGFAIHPWFLYQGGRAETLLTVPAPFVMEAEAQLPTGRLLPAQNTPFDAQDSRSLAGFHADVVYHGLNYYKPAYITYKSLRMRLYLNTSIEFKHLVVYTPPIPDDPKITPTVDFFCVENQTCSSDAHNLYNLGFKKVSNLLVVAPAERHEGYVEFVFQKY